MSKQVTVQPKQDTQKTKKPDITVEQIPAELAGLEKLSSGLGSSIDAISARTQASLLNDARIPTEQRRSMAEHIGRKHGNQYLQRMILQGQNQLEEGISNPQLEKLQSKGDRAAMPMMDQAVPRAQLPVQREVIQRDLNSDIMNAILLSNWSEAVTLLDQLNDEDLNTQIRDQSPEWLLNLQRAATRARLTRVVQAIQNVQLRSGTQSENVEGTRFRTPVTLFQNGVVISKDIKFVKNGRFNSNDDFERLKNRMIDAVRTFLTNRFKIKIETAGGQPQEGDGEYPIRVIFIDNPSATYRMHLYGQRHGRGAVDTNEGFIYELGQAGETETPDMYLAHESAHVLLGAHDEYADAAAPASRQIFTDQSLMGNFYNEVAPGNQPELKARHFAALVRLVSGWFPGRTVSITQ